MQKLTYNIKKMHATAILHIQEIKIFTKRLSAWTHNKKMVAFHQFTALKFKHLAQKTHANAILRSEHETIQCMHKNERFHLEKLWKQGQQPNSNFQI